MKKLIFVLFGVFAVGQVQAFGLGDVLSAGVSAVGKLGGAAIDKAMEDSPEKMEAKRVKEKADLDAKFKEAVAKVETRSDLKPLDKEKQVRTICKVFGMSETLSNMVAQQEIAKRQQRDQMFTVGGVAGVLGNAAMNTPSMMVARADMAVKTGETQAQSRSALAQTDALLQTGQVQERNRAAVAASDRLLNGIAPQSPVGLSDVQTDAGGTPQQKEQIANAIQASVDQHQPEMDAAKAAIEAAKPKQAYVVQTQNDLLAMDKGRKIFVEFVGGKTLTQRLQSAFKDGGYNVVSVASDADVVYQFDGEYSVDAEKNRDGLTEQLGAFSDNPHVIDPPKTKTSAVKSVVGGLFSAMTGHQATQPTPSNYKQQALIVANRSFEGKDLRVSALSVKESPDLECDVLIQLAMRDALSAVGIHNVQLVSSGALMQNISR